VKPYKNESAELECTRFFRQTLIAR
jgi:hypothetical protein